jgi:hypothetical protein
MIYANPEERKKLIAGLRSLADFLEGNPEVPSPRWADVMVFPSATTESQTLREVDAIARVTGAHVDDRTASYGNYTASRDFGPVQYRAVAIPASSRTHHDAQASYSSNVIATASDEEV